MEVIHSVDPDRLTASRPEGDVLWLDLEAPSDRDRLWLAELLELPPRWLDVASRPGHRPLIDHDWVLLAATGARVRAGHGADSVDVRVGLRGSVLLTVHAAAGFGLADRVEHAHQGMVDVLFAVFLALADSVGDALESARSRVVEIQDEAEAVAAGRAAE